MTQDQKERLRDAWLNRPMSVTIHELCPVCSELKQDVKERTFWRYWSQNKMVSCEPCFKAKSDEVSKLTGDF